MTLKAALGLLAGIAPSAWAGVAVTAGPQGPVVAVDSHDLAVFQPTPGEMWVVAKGRGGPTVGGDVAARSAWKVEPLQVSGGMGVRLVAPRPKEWSLTGKPGAWRVEVGNDVPRGQVSFVRLKDGVVMGKPDVVAAWKDQRYALRLAPGVANQTPLAGMPRTLSGLAVDAGHVWGEGRALLAQPLPPAPVVAAAPSATAPEPVLPPGPKVASIKPVETPGKRTVHMEDLPMKHGALAVSASTLYRPGAIVSWTIPPGWKLMEGRAVPDLSGDDSVRKKSVARALGAADDAIARAEAALTPKVVAPSPTANLSESIAALMPVSATEVSGTEHAAGGHEAPHGEQGHAAPATEQVASTEHPAEVVAEVSATVSPSLPVMTEPPAVVVDAGSLAFPPTGDVKDYLPGYWAKMARLVSAMGVKGAKETSPGVVGAREALASYLLAWGRAAEALEVLSMMPQAHEQPVLGRARLLKSVALAAMHRPDDALKALESVPASMAQDAALWKAVALQQQGRSAEAVKTWPTAKGILPKYPAYLREKALIAESEALVAVAPPASAQAFVDGVVKEYPAEEVPPTLARLQGVVRLGTAHEQEGLEMLAKVSENLKDPLAANHAKLDFVLALYHRKELNSVQALKYLEDLRLFWRGDELERTCLRELGRIYAQKGQYREALSRMQTLVKAFPNAPDLAAVSDDMTKAVLSAFDPENPHTYDPLTYLGLYYDFKELLPPDARGDRVAERAGSILVDQGLYERAIPVLDPLLKFRVTLPLDQARIALLLAKAYRLNGQPDMALKTLDTWQKAALNSVQADVWQIETARTLLDLNRPEAAQKALAKLKDEAGGDVAEEMAWRTENWPLLESLAARRVEAPVADLDSARKAHDLSLLRLAYAYSRQGKAVPLQNLIARNTEALAKNPLLADNMEALAVQAGASATAVPPQQPLGQVAAALAGLNGLMDTIKDRKALNDIDQKEQDEYNNRMKYMELLPPPAI